MKYLILISLFLISPVQSEPWQYDIEYQVQGADDPRIGRWKSGYSWTDNAYKPADTRKSQYDHEHESIYDKHLKPLECSGSGYFCD